MVHEGADQFLDLGSGIPTVGNVHEFARAINPAVRVVYVDSDPVDVAYSAILLARVEGTVVVRADLRNTEAILGSAKLAATFDLAKPVGVLMIVVLHFVADEDRPASFVEAYRAVTAPGSYLAITHASSDYQSELARRAEAVYTRASHAIVCLSRPENTGHSARL